jgi:hypothetical protein
MSKSLKDGINEHIDQLNISKITELCTNHHPSLSYTPVNLLGSSQAAGKQTSRFSFIIILHCMFTADSEETKSYELSSK